MDRIDERVEVIVKCGSGKVVPTEFLWRGKTYLIKRVAMRFERRDGSKRYECFAIEAGGLVAELAMDCSDWDWRILKCEPSCT
jgi:hypothetical protein